MFKAAAKSVIRFTALYPFIYLLGVILVPTTTIDSPVAVAENPVTVILEQRADCSTGDDHPDVFPTSAIVTRPNGTLGETKNVDRALKIVFGEVESKTTVHAFCYPTAS